MSQICVEEKSKVLGGRRGSGGCCRCHHREAQSRTRVDSVRVGLFVVQDTSAPGGYCGTADHFHPPAGKQTRLHQPSDTKDSTQLHVPYVAHVCTRTSQKCIRSPIWSSRRGTWNAAWRRSPCGCFQTLRGWWLSNPAGGGWPVDNHPGG